MRISTLTPSETFLTPIPPHNLIIIIITDLGSYTDDNTVTVVTFDDAKSSELPEASVRWCGGG